MNETTFVARWIEGPAAQKLGSALLHFVWQGAALALLALILGFALRRSRPQVRYAVFLGIFSGMALCPVLSFWRTHAAPAPFAEPSIPAATSVVTEPAHTHPPAAPAPASQDVELPWEQERVAGLEPAALPEPEAIPEAPASAPTASTLRWHPIWMAAAEWLWRHRPWIVLCWSLGVGLFSLRLAVGLIGAERAHRLRLSPVDYTLEQAVSRLAEKLAISRTIRVFESAFAEVPTLVGWLCPVVLLPAGLVCGISPDQLEAILAHELAHVRRHDYLVNLLQTIVETVLFYHPAVWWLSRRIREERELCCDDEAVTACGDRLLYARALASLETLRSPPRWAVAASGSSLVMRIRRILGPAEPADSGRPALVGVLAVILLLALSAVHQRDRVTLASSVPNEVNTGITNREPMPLVWGKVVDETGAAVAKAEVTAIVDDGARIVGSSDQAGAFALPLRSIRGGCGIIARDPSKTRSWVGRLDLTDDAELGDLRVALAVDRDVAVEVIDREGRPITGATVVALEQQVEVASSRTADDGTARIVVPGNASALSIHAFQSGSGYDCVVNGRIDGRDRLVGAGPIQIPERVTLRLRGAKSVRVEVVDSGDRPVPGIELVPHQLLRARDEVVDELSHAPSFAVTTGADGAAVFDWLPSDSEENVQFNIRSREYWWDRRLIVRNPSSAERFRILRLTKLSGRVFTAEGLPAADARVEVQGTPTAYEFRFCARTITARDGRFETLVAPEREYFVRAAQVDTLAMATEVATHEDLPASVPDLVLVKSFSLSGVVLSGDGLPLSEESVDLYASVRHPPAFSFMRRASTDAEGRYRFVVEPGQQFVTLSGTHNGQMVTVSKDGPQQIIQDFSVPRAGDAPFFGRVVDSKGEPIARADVLAYYSGESGQIPGWRLLTDRDGMFTFPRKALPMVIRLTTADGKLAVIATIDADQQAGTFEPLPPLEVRGRLLSGHGTPMPNARMYRYVRVSTGANLRRHEGFRSRFGAAVMTDGEGRYVFPDVPSGARWSIAFEKSWPPTDVDLLADGPRVHDLGDTKLPRPSGPPTLRELVNAQFHLGEALADRMTVTKVEAQRRGRPILVYLGDPAADYSWKLKAALENRANATLFRASSQLPQLWVRAANEEVAAKSLTALGIEPEQLAKPKPPLIALVTQDGKLLESMALTKGADGMIDTPPLLELLLRHVPADKEANRAEADPAKAPAVDTKKDNGPESTGDQPKDPAASNSEKPEKAADAARARKGWSVWGKITDIDGKPLAGVTVTAHAGMGSLRRTGAAESDAEGKYELEFGPGVAFGKDTVQLQAATIAARKPGFSEKNLSRQGDLLAAYELPDEKSVVDWGKKKEDVLLPGQPRRIDFVMVPAATISGTLIDKDEKPLAGYSISLRGDEMPPSSSVVASTKTDEQGHFTLADVPAGYRWQFLVEPDRRAPPWNAWASGGHRFETDKDSELATHRDEREFVAERFELQVLGAGVNWKKALKIGYKHQSLQSTGDVLEGPSRVRAKSARLVLDPPEEQADEDNQEPASPTNAPSESKFNLQRTVPDAEGHFAIGFDNPFTKKGARRWALDPEKHQVIFQVFVKDAAGKLVEKIFKQLPAREAGGYTVDVQVQPELIASSTVSVTFVTIQPEHDAWVKAFFHEGRGTKYKGIWSTEAAKLPAVPLPEK